MAIQRVLVKSVSRATQQEDMNVERDSVGTMRYDKGGGEEKVREGEKQNTLNTCMKMSKKKTSQ